MAERPRARARQAQAGRFVPQAAPGAPGPACLCELSMLQLTQWRQPLALARAARSEVFAI